MTKPIKKKSFLKKLNAMLNEPTYEKYIKWDKEGKTIIIPDEKKFSEIVLPKRFSHNNFSSFVRQLNLYKFKGKRQKCGYLRYENKNFHKNMTDEEIEKLEEKECKNKNIKLNKKEDEKIIIDTLDNNSEIIDGNKINFNEYRGKLDKCLNEIEEILNYQKELYKEIENIKNEKRKSNNSINNYFKNLNKDINASILSIDNNEKVNNSLIINNNDDEENNDINNNMSQNNLKESKNNNFINIQNLNKSHFLFK